MRVQQYFCIITVYVTSSQYQFWYLSTTLQYLAYFAYNYWLLFPSSDTPGAWHLPTVLCPC